MAKRTTPTHRKASASRSRATGEVPVPAHAPCAVEKIEARKQGDGGSFRAGLGDHAALQVFRALLEAATGRGGNYEHLRSAVAQARDRFPEGDPRRRAPLPGAPPTGEYDGRNDHARGVAVGLLDGLVTWEEAIEALAWPATGAADPMRQLRIAGHLNARWRAVRALAQVVQAAPWLGRALAPTIYAAPWMHRLREEDAQACAEQARLHPREAMRALAALACLERTFGTCWDGATWDTLRRLLEVPELARHGGPLRVALDPGPDAPPPPVMVRELEDANAALAVATGAGPWVGPPMRLADAAGLLHAVGAGALRKRIKRAKPSDPLHIFQPGQPGRLGRYLAGDAVRYIGGCMKAGAELEREAIAQRKAAVDAARVPHSRRRDLQALDRQ